MEKHESYKNCQNRGLKRTKVGHNTAQLGIAAASLLQSGVVMTGHPEVEDTTLCVDEGMLVGAEDISDVVEDGKEDLKRSVTRSKTNIAISTELEYVQ